MLPVGSAPKSSGLKGSPEVEPWGKERRTPSVEPEALPMAGSDPALPAQPGNPGGTAQAQGINGVICTNGAEADLSAGRELITLPRTRVPGKGVKSRLPRQTWTLPSVPAGLQQPVGWAAATT